MFTPIRRHFTKTAPGLFIANAYTALQDDIKVEKQKILAVVRKNNQRHISGYPYFSFFSGLLFPLRNFPRVRDYIC